MGVHTPCMVRLIVGAEEHHRIGDCFAYNEMDMGKGERTWLTLV